MSYFKVTHENEVPVKETRRLSFTRDDLDTILTSPEYSPRRLIQLLSGDFNDEYSADAGVWERYTIGQHTEMVLTQFDRYFGETPLPGDIDHNFFRTMLALHDIGKPQAIRKGNKALQHHFTVPIMDSTLDILGFNEEERNLAKALVDGDFLGDALKGGDITLSAERIINASKASSLNDKNFFDLLTVFYRVDAGSYTVDAGGKPALDRLFVFNRESRQLNFAPAQQQIVDNLSAEVLSGQVSS